MKDKDVQLLERRVVVLETANTKTEKALKIANNMLKHLDKRVKILSSQLNVQQANTK